MSSKVKSDRQTAYYTILRPLFRASVGHREHLQMQRCYTTTTTRALMGHNLNIKHWLAEVWKNGQHQSRQPLELHTLLQQQTQNQSESLQNNSNKLTSTSKENINYKYPSVFLPAAWLGTGSTATSSSPTTPQQLNAYHQHLNHHATTTTTAGRCSQHWCLLPLEDDFGVTHRALWLWRKKSTQKMTLKVLFCTMSCSCNNNRTTSTNMMRQRWRKIMHYEISNINNNDLIERCHLGLTSQQWQNGPLQQTRPYHNFRWTHAC